ncbi:uncharacterized protein V1510DRAFT_198536 [Dipodascopsis tothii]|uniref:uncharacterized protein n=1 Tax=Dipodascopsis tothii TaxID=44089 RepID=UPI0034CDEAA0
MAAEAQKDGTLASRRRRRVARPTVEHVDLLSFLVPVETGATGAQLSSGVANGHAVAEKNESHLSSEVMASDSPRPAAEASSLREDNSAFLAQVAPAAESYGRKRPHNALPEQQIVSRHQVGLNAKAIAETVHSTQAEYAASSVETSAETAPPPIEEFVCLLGRSSIERVPDSRWEGRPNFKRFKKKTVAHRQPIALIEERPADFGIGDEYWLQKSDFDLPVKPPQPVNANSESIGDAVPLFVPDSMAMESESSGDDQHFRITDMSKTPALPGERTQRQEALDRPSIENTVTSTVLSDFSDSEDELRFRPS